MPFFKHLISLTKLRNQRDWDSEKTKIGKSDKFNWTKDYFVLNTHTHISYVLSLNWILMISWQSSFFAAHILKA